MVVHAYVYVRHLIVHLHGPPKINCRLAYDRKTTVILNYLKFRLVVSGNLLPSDICGKGGAGVLQ